MPADVLRLPCWSPGTDIIDTAHASARACPDPPSACLQMISNAYARLSARNHPGDDDDLDDLDPDDIFDEDDFEEFADFMRSEFFYRM